MLRVLHVADLGFGLGGISQVVPRMIQEQNKLHGVETQLLVPSASKYRTNLGFICHSTTNLETIEKTIVNTFKPDLAVFMVSTSGIYQTVTAFDCLSIPYDCSTWRFSSCQRERSTQRRWLTTSSFGSL